MQLSHAVVICNPPDELLAKQMQELHANAKADDEAVKKALRENKLYATEESLNAEQDRN